MRREFSKKQIVIEIRRARADSLEAVIARPAPRRYLTLGRVRRLRLLLWAEFEVRFSKEASCREYLIRLRWTKELAGARVSAAMWGLPVSELGDGRDNLPRHTQAPYGLVPGDVGRHAPKGHQCYQVAADAGLGKLRHRLDLAA